ncbi:nitrate- and nitrite sensing domain-containing protein [Actinoplanes sp. NPDC049265]|uniref:nitrate- and nitrite sensing domain-containing protein n=1 Tax=Actinoplanes sp. NPDC049265 TaxID=3363902 RepID=UPI00371873CD
MSKRPKPANGVMSRLRRPAGRLRDLPIWSKLGLIMLVPTLATIIVGVNGLVDHIEEASNAEQARTLAVLSQASGGLVDQLQNERASAVTIARTFEPDEKGRKNDPVRAKALQQYQAVHPKVDAAKVPYSQQKAALDLDGQDNVKTLLSRLDLNLSELPVVRTQVSNGDRDVEDVDLTYGRIIGDLLNVRDVSAQLAGDNILGDHMRAAAAVARMKEFTAQTRDVGIKIVDEGDLTVALRRELDLADSGFQLADANLTQVGTPAEVTDFRRTVDGEAKRQATNFILPLSALQGANTKNIPFTLAGWEQALTGYNGLFRQVETRFDAAIVSSATDLRDGVQREVFIETSALLGMLLLAILFAWLVARSMARSLRELRQGALSVAQYGLPHAVNRLRDPSLSSSLTPAQVADQVAEPLPVRSRDEFGQVTEAFNAVHLEAVRTAAEQAALRASVATMFVNLARRSQILVDRLIGHLDRLERGEEDPDRLAELFQLDHLATRMRRNDENLLVLAGADSTRVQREPAALIDVLRAAQSEVEHYTRIEFGTVDRDIEVAAHAVNDMVHLVAELFDNATAFSPPNSTVLVEARRLGDGAILSVEDRGIGISHEQLRDLNERLANPPMVDVAVSRMMGLVVVARLANRHGVKVELRPAGAERGTVAEVGLPISVLISSAGGNRLPSGQPQPQQPQFGGDPAVTQARPAFPEPLALESGRGGGGYPGGRPFDPNPPMPNGGMLGTGRSVPAWSDLTGAPTNGGGMPPINGGGMANGSNGSNGFHGPRSNEPIPPIPSGPSNFGGPDGPQGFGGPDGPQGFAGPDGPQGFAGPDGLPQRRNGESFRPDATDTMNGFGSPTIPRQLPSNPESQGGRGFGPPPVSGPPAPPVSAPPVPSSSPFDRGPATPPQPPEPEAYPAPTNGAGAPPAWPPVAPERDNTPHVPESLAAALDMTAELPRYRPENRPGTQPAPRTDSERAVAAHEAATAQAAEAQATAAAQIAAAQARQRAEGGQGQYADETMELPIFRELESAWFTTAKRPADPTDDAIVSQRIPTGEPTRSVPQQPQPAPVESRDLDPVGAVAGAGAATANGPWQTAADEGWTAARAAAETPVEATTTAGLPKRKPMAQLVPGGVDRAETSTQRRTPEAVRGLLSAYHRGVQRGRTKEQSTNPEGTSGGQQSFQAGKEHEA